MDFLKIFADMEELFEPFTDDQRGRLFSAMMAYAFRGEAPAFDGPERYVWPALRRHIDQCAEKQRAQEENGKKGGRPPKNPTKPNETQQNPTKPSKTQRNPTKPNETQKEQEQEHTQEQEQEQEQETSASAPGRIIGIDGSDLTQAIADEAQAERLVAQYMPRSRSPLGLDPRVGEISGLIGRLGLPRVEAAFRDAVKSDTRGGISVAFVKAIAEGERGPKTRAAPDGYQRRNYTAEDYRAMETDLSDELEALKARG